MSSFRQLTSTGSGPATPRYVARQSASKSSARPASYASPAPTACSNAASSWRRRSCSATIVLSSEFPGKYPSVWEDFRAAQPNAPIVAHGMNNTNHILPLGRGLAEQKAYIRRTLTVTVDATGVRPVGWSSPSVYSNGDTPQAAAAEGITYTLDQMDSDIIQRLKTPEGPGAAALSGGHGRHGPAARPDERAQRRSRLCGRITFWNAPLRPAPTLRAKRRRLSLESTHLWSERPTAQRPCAGFLWSQEGGGRLAHRHRHRRYS
jgi:hypothetical protein